MHTCMHAFMHACRPKILATCLPICMHARLHACTHTHTAMHTGTHACRQMHAELLSINNQTQTLTPIQCNYPTPPSLSLHLPHIVYLLQSNKFTMAAPINGLFHQSSKVHPSTQQQSAKMTASRRRSSDKSTTSLASAVPSVSHVSFQPSLTRQLAFGELAQEAPNVSSSAYDYRSNCCAKVATAIILLITVALFLVFFFKNKQLEQRHRQMFIERRQQSTQISSTTVNPNLTEF